MSTAEKSTPTPDEIRKEAALTANIIKSYTLCLDATIDDYPIGRRERGQCRLQVERVKGKGYRTVRTTTDKFGRWCKPKKSTFRDDCTAVITGLGGERDTRWLCVGERGAYLQDASGATHTLIEAPHYCRPNREPRTYTMQTTRFSPYRGGDAVRSEEQHVIPADPAELCDAYDAWLEVYRDLRALVAAAWDNPSD